MTRQERWDRRYLELARHVGQWSKDPSTKVGAVLVRPNNSVLSTGYNGFPPGWDDSPELYADREYKYRHVIHAEVNALNFAGRQSGLGCSLYTSFPCCPSCVAGAGLAGVRRIVCPVLPTEGRERSWIAEWEGRVEEAKGVAATFGVPLEFMRV